MQAVIMAGGKGTRLAAVTKDEIPKPMVPLAGKPLLLWQIEELKRNGISDIILVVGHLGHKITEFFQDGSGFGVHISYIKEQAPLGTAGAFYELKELLQGQYFLLVFGDVYFSIDIRRMEQFHQVHQAEATLFVHPNGHPYDSDLVVLDAQDRILRFDFKQDVRNGWYDNCVNAGFYILSRSVCSFVQKAVKTDLEKDVLAPLAEQGGAVYGYRSSEYIKDIGTVRRVRQTEADIADGYIRRKCLAHKQKCIFLNPDGTLHGYKGPLRNEEAFELEETAARAVRRINGSGYLGIAAAGPWAAAGRSCGMPALEIIYKKMAVLLGKEGAYLDGVYCSPQRACPGENPQHKGAGTCREPDIGIILQAAERFNIDLAQSWLIGDTTADIQAGNSAGMHTALVLTGQAGKDGKYQAVPELVCENLLDAVEKIVPCGKP